MPDRFELADDKVDKVRKESAHRQDPKDRPDGREHLLLLRITIDEPGEDQLYEPDDDHEDQAGERMGGMGMHHVCVWWHCKVYFTLRDNRIIFWGSGKAWR